MKLVKATPADSDRLIEYHKNSMLEGPFNVQFERVGNFFEHYRLQSDDYVTYMLLNKHDEIEAIASLIFREGWINGEKHRIGYATDLRVSTTRRAIMQWAQKFLPILEEECNQRNCKYVFSVLAKTQRQAYNAFIRPRSTRRKMARYYMYRRFDLVSLHGRYPFSPKPIDTINIAHANPFDQSDLAEYVVKMKSRHPVHYCEDDQRFYNEIFRWKDLAIEDFIIARDYEGQIIGCMAPWSPEKVQIAIQAKVNPVGRTFKESVRFLSLLGMTHKLSPSGSAMNFKFLTHIYADNPDIFYALLVKAWSETSKDQFLIYPHFENHLLTEPPRSFVSATQPFGLYLILSPSTPMPDFIKPQLLSEPPDFEMAFY